MHLNLDATPSTDPKPADGDQAQGVNAPDLRIFVFALFLVFGGITSLNDVIIPKWWGNCAAMCRPLGRCDGPALRIANTGFLLRGDRLLRPAGAPTYLLTY
jgi:hypothetical protein